MALVRLISPYGLVSGRLGTEPNVNTSYSNQPLIRQFTQPFNPSTTDQVAVRNAFSSLTKNWKDLDQSQRDAWVAWATSHVVTNRLGNKVARGGVSAYVELGSINFFRTGVLLEDAPTLSQPAPATSISSLTNVTTNSWSIDVEHAISSLTGLYLMARSTPALISPAITPPLSSYRMASGVGSGSFKALAATGSTYTFSATRYEYGNGDLAGIEVQIVNAEGWASQPFRSVQTATT